MTYAWFDVTRNAGIARIMDIFFVGSHVTINITIKIVTVKMHYQDQCVVLGWMCLKN